jgi:Leucine-rich repeat (LRR) protein
MKKNQFLTIFMVLLLCTPAVHAAASSGATAYEQYKNAFTNANINGIVAAFLDLPQSDRWNPHYLVPLIKALIKEKRIHPMYIDALEVVFGSYSPLIKWLRSIDTKPSRELLAYLRRLSVPTQPNAPTPIISQKAKEKYPSPIVPIDRELMQRPIPSLRDLALEVLAKNVVQKPIIRLPLLNSSESMPELPAEERRAPAPLRQLVKKTMDRPIKQVQPPFAQQITPEMLKLIESRLTVPIVNVQETDVWNMINNLPSVMGVNITNTAIAQDLFEKVATQIAHDAYLQLRKEGKLDYYLGLFQIGNKQLSPKEGYNQLSPFLKTHFKGVSIQDLIDNDLLPAIKYKILTLSEHFINNLSGFKNIPDINNLYHLSLGDNLITEILPEEFTGVTGLRSLSLGYNKITKIAPEAFAGLTGLQHLYLEHNQITEIAPKAFAGLTGLQRLNLEYNQISEIAPEAFAGLTDLQRLNLLGNQINKIAPETFAGLTGLQKLNLYDNQISEIAPEAFAGLTGLQEIFLNGNQITKIAPETFAGLTGLQDLYLNGNQITKVDPETFAGLISLQYLTLRGNPIPEFEHQQIRDDVHAFAPDAIIQFYI